MLFDRLVVHHFDDGSDGTLAFEDFNLSHLSLGRILMIKIKQMIPVIQIAQTIQIIQIIQTELLKVIFF